MRCPACKADLRDDGVYAWCVNADCARDAYSRVARNRAHKFTPRMVTLDGLPHSHVDPIRRAFLALGGDPKTFE